MSSFLPPMPVVVDTVHDETETIVVQAEPRRIFSPRAESDASDIYAGREEEMQQMTQDQQRKEEQVARALAEAKAAEAARIAALPKVKVHKPIPGAAAPLNKGMLVLCILLNLWPRTCGLGTFSAGLSPMDARIAWIAVGVGFVQFCLVFVPVIGIVAWIWSACWSGLLVKEYFTQYKIMHRQITDLETIDEDDEAAPRPM